MADDKIVHREETLDYAYISDTKVKLPDGRETRTTFIRIVRPETVNVERINTYDAESVMVDTDENGQIIGVTVFSI